MDRRRFSQWLTFGATTWNLRQNNARDKANGDKAPASKPTEVASSTDAANALDFARLAERNLPKATIDYINTGSADEWTLQENVDAFQRIPLYPPLLTGVAKADTSVTILNQKIAIPILLAPVAAQRMYHEEGGRAAARAAAAMNTIYGMSSSVGNSVEEIAQSSNGSKWFQLYVPKDRQIATRLVQRVERAGYDAIILTVDLGEWKDADKRNRFRLPKSMLVKHLKDIGFTHINSNMTTKAIEEFNAQAWNLTLSWDFFDYLRSITKLPILIKGVLRKKDAQRAVDSGLDGIIVSNHGGRRLDGMPSTIDSLPGIVDAVGGKIDILMDGGIRRGTDVLKAIARGAKAVLIGRPYAWALAANGEAGVRQVLEMLRDELINAMIATGCAKVADISEDLLKDN